MTTQSIDCDYWKKYVEGKAFIFDYPACAFGNYDRKLRDSLKIVMFLQPEWIEVMIQRTKLRNATALK